MGSSPRKQGGEGKRKSGSEPNSNTQPTQKAAALSSFPAAQPDKSDHKTKNLQQQRMATYKHNQPQVKKPTNEQTQPQRTQNGFSPGMDIVLQSEDDVSEMDDNYHSVFDGSYDGGVDDENVEDEIDEKKPQKSNKYLQMKRRRRCRRICVWLVISIIPLLLIFVLTIVIGHSIERKRTGRRPEPTYDTTTVCATQGGGDAVFTHYDNATEARTNDDFVAHCGNCGQCSNPADLFRLSSADNTLDVEIAACSWHVLWGGTGQCLRQKMSFSDACHDCWSRFLTCSVSNCKFSCFTTRFTESSSCVDCRERFCSSELQQCSGPDRKRLGFVDYANQDTVGQICEEVDRYWSGL